MSAAATNSPHNTLTRLAETIATAYDTRVVTPSDAARCISLLRFKQPEHPHNPGADRLCARTTGGRGGSAHSVPVARATALEWQHIVNTYTALAELAARG